ncbi:class II D-tagatose-bisphosphate aldolase, non-catalytic subunit [Pannonibacter sp. SL95]|uniref:class II D-tagatose-bisphosphate aldolase, non-catalytic subunit n=1 Tax=Pannonibacter sp. SL95 TaxID=2995153 RepID=UPI0022742EF8|nr:class II D-tagatose-bisphosphate aldolase, non-catalytic subunit [Pannonibacter sp. SL95]MCY1704666.1 class II D-tagatose-bisphosphate aldolase, non-catalytic subunit [Pannonibacter sp. SL95]
MDKLTSFLRANRAGSGKAMPSVCSAHEHVLMAALMMAQSHQQTILIEATSNQVNQFGGYTGMEPIDFANYIELIAKSVGVDMDLVILGGDHLGPQVWRSEPADVAMRHAADMIRDYVNAGFRKIHLDCSEGCAGEPAQVGDALAAGRAAQLAKVCEETAPGQVLYVIGTEVPPPGGARADEHGITPTSPERARATLEAHRQAFSALGLDSAFARVRGLVVQPGLEFAPSHIDHFDRMQPDLLSAALDGYPDLCFEAHSTDYQRNDVYPDLARRHFGILKVGPALTFAWREALYGLSHIDSWLHGKPHISQTMEKLMLANPKPWQGHYPDDRALRHFGYADRIRYYWNEPKARKAINAMLTRLAESSIPEPLLHAYIPKFTATLAGIMTRRGIPLSKAILLASVKLALEPYMEDRTSWLEAQ